MSESWCCGLVDVEEEEHPLIALWPKAQFACPLAVAVGKHSSPHCDQCCTLWHIATDQHGWPHNLIRPPPRVSAARCENIQTNQHGWLMRVASTRISDLLSCLMELTISLFFGCFKKCSFSCLLFFFQFHVRWLKRRCIFPFRARFDGLLSGVVSQCLQPVAAVLESAGVEKSAIDKVQKASDKMFCV